MMKPIRTSLQRILPALVLLGAALSCEKEMTLNLKNRTPKIVMNGIIVSDSLIEINVSKSFLYTDTAADKSLLREASLRLFINGDERETMRMTGIDSTRPITPLGYQPLLLQLVFRSTVRPRAGDRVRIEASAEGLPTVWAETVVPLPPDILHVDTATFFTSGKLIRPDYAYSSGSDFGYPDTVSEERDFRNLRIKAEIKVAPSDASQYFMLQTYTRPNGIVEESRVSARRLFLYTDDDPVFLESPPNGILEDILTESNSGMERKHSDKAFFSDNLFRNKRHTLDFSVTNVYEVYTVYEKIEDEWSYFPIYKPIKTEVFHFPLEVSITTLSPELYRYYRKGNDVLNSDAEAFNMFSEPQTSLTNVHNGIGIVGAMSVASAQIDIPPFPGPANVVPK